MYFSQKAQKAQQRSPPDKAGFFCLSEQVCGYLQVATLFVEIILVGADGEFVAGGFVAHDDGMWVHLEHGGCPLVADVAVDAMLEGACLVVAAAHEEHFLGVHHRADADGECLLGNEREVAVEEAAVGMDGVGGEGLDAGA